MPPTYTAPEQITATYDHVYLSPHLDDASLSCGGAIITHTAAGARVLVVTLCTAVPTMEQLGPLAEEFHGDWNLEHEDAVTARLREDLDSMHLLGADCLWAGMLDSIYRMPFAYDTRERLFGMPRREDPLFTQLMPFLHSLKQRLPHARYYAPLGVGYHVDHQITFEVAERVFGQEQLYFYEDIYYVLLPGELEKRQHELARQMPPELIDISTTVERKIAAIDAYASQIPELFGGSEPMAQAIRTYAAQVGPVFGERVWRGGL